MTTLKASKLADLTGHVALVTGGGTGIGNIIARGLAANGATIYITGRRKEVLEKAAADASSAALKLIPLVMDVADKDSVRSAAQVIKDKEAKLHILVNNAGRSGPIARVAFDPSAPEHKDTETFSQYLFDSQGFDEWNATYQTNVASIFFVTYAFLGLLEVGARDLGAGETTSIVNISSSIATSHMTMGMHCYLSTKAAVNHLSVSMATEFALKKIPVRVNVVAPGYFVSEMTDPMMEDVVKMDQPIPVLVSPFPTKRHGRQEEMTMCILSLVASAGCTNGQIVSLDGGLSLVNP
ncbi:short-chain dehydrogenase [Neolentinus lepideus HHB14362 ss-1]|uniref:Short-chain dehydrogenase n=1 Tax=Neolentinus lepideus HHB14362 ss-1 TaxID=1314782 RepID=A0A165QPS2_9AGAM|nr:short-chain dehydrogenase [Neolentinus lepideus HHB14362 ss-1]